MVTTEMIEARLALLRQERDQLRANLHAYDGAIQEAEYWLAQVRLEESAPDREVGPHVLRTA